MNQNWFSNFVPFDEPLVFDDIKYVTPEHFYQAMKTADINERRLIAAAETPGKAKRLGSKVKLVDNWDMRKIIIMQLALAYKFTQNTSHGKRLMKTTEPLVEVVLWHDNFWGNCICQKCRSIPGENNLGKLLMDIRTTLKREEALNGSGN